MYRECERAASALVENTLTVGLRRAMAMRRIKHWAVVPQSAPCVTKVALANLVVWAAYLAREASTLRLAARGNAASAA